MAKYTIELYKLLDEESGFKDMIISAFNSFNLLNDVGNKHRQKLWEDFVARYEFCEIGFETPALFVRYLKNRTREVVNKYDYKFVYLDELLSREIVVAGKTTTTVEYGKTTHTKDEPNYNETNSGSDETTNDEKIITDDTPQKGININEAFSNERFASGMEHSKSSGSVDYGMDKHIHGITKDESITDGGRDKTIVETTPISNSFDNIEKIKNIIYNYDNEFIEEFKDLFMLVY